MPGAVGMDVAGANGSVDELSELGWSGFGDHGGTAWAVGGDGAVLAGEIGALQVAQAGCSVARAGAADGDVPEPLDGAGDEFAVETAADQDGQAVFAEAPCAGEQAAVPEGVDGWGRAFVPRGCAGLADVFVAECGSETADDEACKARYYRKREALLQVVGGGHLLSLPFGDALPVVRSQSSA